MRVSHDFDYREQEKDIELRFKMVEDVVSATLMIALTTPLITKVRKTY